MNQKFALGSSISFLISGVIAVLAFVRGKWEIPLLLIVFLAWGLWVVLGLLLPSWRTNRAYKRRERQAMREREASAVSEADLFSQDTARMLLCHINYRISDHLKAAYPDVRWEWTMRDPLRFVTQGGTGRIRLFGVPDFEYAGVRLNQKGELDCSLVKIVPVDGQGAPFLQTAADPHAWYELQGRRVLEKLIADLQSRGHSSLILKEDGSICIQPMDGGEEIAQERFASFPQKDSWPQLADVLMEEGFATVVQDNCIAVAW